MVIDHSYRSIDRRHALIALASMWAAGHAPAQGEGRVRLIVPTSAGSGTDAAARALQPGLGAALGMPVVVENMPGASGQIGLQTVARASPQDLTFAVITSGLSILPSVVKNFPLDVVKDFTPVSMLMNIPMVLAANAKVPALNAKELISLLKGKPDTLNFGSSGSGSVSHLATEIFLDEAKVKARHIPYQGPNPMTVALIGGQIDFATQAVSLYQPHFKNGSIRPIGVCSSKRSPAAPDIPTMAEQGLPEVVCDAWVTLIGPKGMPASTVTKINEAVAKAFSNAELQHEIARQGNAVMLSSPDEALRTIRDDRSRYAALVKRIGLAPS